MSTTLGLAMLVRDEAEALGATLERALPEVEHVTLLDTGSVDETLSVARETLCGISHSIFETGWRGFGPARSELLVHARKAGTDYTLMLDADHVLHVEGERPELEADAYMLRIRGTQQWRLPLLTSNSHDFEYLGVAHAYLHSRGGCTKENLDWLSIDGGPGASHTKLERDRILLEQAHAADPGDARTVFYLAQTYRDLDMVEPAIHYYRMRAEMAGFEEERYFARYQLGVLLSAHVSFARGADELLKAWRSRPHRVEALRALARAANGVADKYPLPDDALFVEPSAYLEARP